MSFQYILLRIFIWDRSGLRGEEQKKDYHEWSTKMANNEHFVQLICCLPLNICNPVLFLTTSEAVMSGISNLLTLRSRYCTVQRLRRPEQFANPRHQMQLVPGTLDHRPLQ